MTWFPPSMPKPRDCSPGVSHPNYPVASTLTVTVMV